MLEVEQSVGKQVEALPSEQMQDFDTLVVPKVRSSASFETAF
jgi:hypothetical protein